MTNKLSIPKILIISVFFMTMMFSATHALGQNPQIEPSRQFAWLETNYGANIFDGTWLLGQLTSPSINYQYTGIGSGFGGPSVGYGGMFSPVATALTALYGAYGQTPDIMTRPFYNTTGYISGNFLGQNTSYYQAATQLDAYRFPGINQNIQLKDYFSNYSWFNHYEYPSFNNPVNGGTNFPADSYWLLIGLLLPQRSPVDHLSQGYAYFQKGQYESAIEELNTAIRLPYEKVAKVQGYLLLGMSYQYLGTEYLEDAEKYLEFAAGLEVYNTEVILQLAKVYYQQGKYSKAIEEYRRVVEKEPENGEAIRGLALSYFKANELTKALKELHKVEIKDPNDLEIMYTTGIIFEEKHLFTEAIQYLNKVIDRAPDSSWALQARDHLQDIERSGDASSIDDIKEEEIKMLIMTAPEPEEMPDDDLIILLDDIHYEILPDNTLIYRIHKLMKILNNRGKGAGEVKLSYDSTYQHITIDLARVIKPDGTIIGVGADNIQEVAPWVDFPFYGNTKVLIISMPGLTVGSIIEYQATIEDIPGSTRFNHREIDACFSLASLNPVRKARIELSIPTGRGFSATVANREPLEPEIILDGEMSHFTWTLDDIPGMIVEPMMPPLLDISPILYVTSLPSWEIIADWWRELEFQAIVPDDAIRSEVSQLTENLYTQEDKARALFHYVASEIRYVGLEYGKGGIRPHMASQVYENKYGDCKDKSILLITMLREVGIEAYPVLVSTVFNGRAWEEVPRINAFDHVITLCIIDDAWIWMDSTVETSSFGDIPGSIQDREALIIFDNGYEFMPIPVVAPDKNMDQEIMNIQVAEDSSAMVSSTTTSTGFNAMYSRAYFKALDPIYRKQQIEEVITGRATGGKLIDFTIGNLDDLTQPYKLELTYKVPEYVEWAGDIGFIKVSHLSPNKAAKDPNERIYPISLENTSVGESTIYINLPEDLEILYMPPPVTLEIPQILFISEYTVQDHTIVYYLRYEIRQVYVPLEDYPEYKEFQEQVDKELNRKIIVHTN